MQTLHASALNGVTPVQYPIIQSMARNQWIDVNNESAVTLSVSLGGRIYLIPPNTTARYAMDNTETFVTFTPQSAADPTKDTVSGTIYNEQDSIPVEVERGANASDILPITSAMIADGAVIAAKVATDAINTANIVAGAVGTTQLANGSVTNPILASLAVANANIQANAVAATQIATGAVTTTKIANLAVTTALIANAAVGTAQIANAAITTALIQTAAITDALIANVSAGKITAGTISASISIIGPTITGGLIQTASSGARVAMDSAHVDRVLFYSGGGGEINPAAIISSANLLLQAAQFSGTTPASISIQSDFSGAIPQVAYSAAYHSMVAQAFGAGGVARSLILDGRSTGGITITSSAVSISMTSANGLMTEAAFVRIRVNGQDVGEEVGNGSQVARTVNYASSAYREHDASIHQNLSDIRFKDVKETDHSFGHHRDIVRQVGRPFTFNWKDGHGDNGKHTRWGLDARQLPAEFTKQEEIGETTAYLVDPQSMIAVLFGAVNDLIDEIELLKGSK